MALGELTIADVLGAHGYESHMIGLVAWLLGADIGAISYIVVCSCTSLAWPGSGIWGEHLSLFLICRADLRFDSRLPPGTTSPTIRPTAAS